MIYRLESCNTVLYLCTILYDSYADDSYPYCDTSVSKITRKNGTQIEHFLKY